MSRRPRRSESAPMRSAEETSRVLELLDNLDPPKRTVSVAEHQEWIKAGRPAEPNEGRDRR